MTTSLQTVTEYEKLSRKIDEYIRKHVYPMEFDEESYQLYCNRDADTVAEKNEILNNLWADARSDIEGALPSIESILFQYSACVIKVLILLTQLYFQRNHWEEYQSRLLINAEAAEEWKGEMLEEINSELNEDFYYSGSDNRIISFILHYTHQQNIAVECEGNTFPQRVLDAMDIVMHDAQNTLFESYRRLESSWIEQNTYYHADEELLFVNRLCIRPNREKLLRLGGV